MNTEAEGNDDRPDDIARDVATVGRIDAVPTLLRVVCDMTGMGFSAVARVTGQTWTACAVQDDIAFGLTPGSQLELNTTLCAESRAARAPIVVDRASTDPVYRDHHTPRLYNIESYISVPIVLEGGEYFGNLCAIDPEPREVSGPKTVAMFTRFAELIAIEIGNDRSHAHQNHALALEKAQGELRDQFIAILGHDLRGPLNGMAAGAEYLQLAQAGLPPQARDVARRIGSSARRMSRLIDDILDFARGRLGGGFEVRIDTVEDVEQALREVVGDYQQSHPERRLIVDIEAPRPVRCDRSRLQQLLSNLLANAIQHGTASEPIYVSAKADAQTIALTVSNGGEPIPADNLPHVFSPFWRQSTSASRKGLGLGLFICAEIVKAHRGSIEVVSSADIGTTFAVSIPTGRAGQALPTAAA